MTFLQQRLATYNILAFIRKSNSSSTFHGHPDFSAFKKVLRRWKKKAIISDLLLSSGSWSQHGFEHEILTKSLLVERSASENAKADPGKHFCSERLSTQANLLHDCTNYGKGV